MIAASRITRQLHRLRRHAASSRAIARACLEATLIAEEEPHRLRLAVAGRRIRECADSFYVNAFTDPGEATRLVIRHRRDCKHFLCPLSNRAKAARMRQKITTIVDIAQKATPHSPLLFLNFTIRNRPWSELAAQLDDLTAAQDRFWKLALVKRAFLGYITSHEVVCRGKPSAPQAGAHSHALVAAHPDYFSPTDNRYRSQRTLTQLFQQALRCEYPPIVHIARVRAPDGSTGGASLHWATKELIKYCIKPAELFKHGTDGLEADPAIIAVLARALYRRRMMRLGGVFAAASKVYSQQQKEDPIED